MHWYGEVPSCRLVVSVAGHVVMHWCWGAWVMMQGYVFFWGAYCVDLAIGISVKCHTPILFLLLGYGLTFPPVVICHPTLAWPGWVCAPFLWVLTHHRHKKNTLTPQFP